MLVLKMASLLIQKDILTLERYFLSGKGHISISSAQKAKQTAGLKIINEKKKDFLTNVVAFLAIKHNESVILH